MPNDILSLLKGVNKYFDKTYARLLVTFTMPLSLTQCLSCQVYHPSHTSRGSNVNTINQKMKELHTISMRSDRCSITQLELKYASYPVNFEYCHSHMDFLNTTLINEVFSGLATVKAKAKGK